MQWYFLVAAAVGWYVYEVLRSNRIHREEAAADAEHKRRLEARHADKPEIAE